MKRISVLLAASLTFFSFVNSNLINDLQKEGLKGKVKSVTSSLGTYYYDLNGYKLSWFQVVDSLMVRKRTFIHDNSGNIIEEKEYLSNGSVKRKQTYQYDDFGNLITQVDSCHYFSRYTYHNNYKDQRIMESLIYDSKSFYSGKISYSYDKAGNKILETRLNKDGRLYGYIKYHRGNIIETSDSIRTQKKTYRYRKGKVIEMKEYSFDGRLFIITRFDKKGNKKQVIAYRSKDRGRKSRWKYDNLENIVYSVHYDEIGLKHKTIFKIFYDHQGNWIKKVFTDSTNPNKSNVIERQITYY